MKKWYPGMVGLTILFSLTGCMNNTEPVEMPALPPAHSDMSAAMVVEDISVRDVAASKETSRFAAREGRQMTYQIALSLSVDDVARAMAQAENLVRSAGGYVQETDGRSGVLRVPVDRADEVLKQLEALGRVDLRRIVANDVTDAVTDLEVRLKNYRTMQTRLLSLLERADKVEDALKIETELNRVVTEIERHEGMLARLANQVRFVTLNLSFSALSQRVEVPKLPVQWMTGLGAASGYDLPAPNGRSDLPYDLTLPEGFAVIYAWDNGPVRELWAATADNCVLRLTRCPGLEGASTDFWQTLARRALTEVNRYEIIRDELLTLGDKEEAVRFEARRGNRRCLVQLASRSRYFCFIPLEPRIYLLEFWGPEEAYEKHAEAVRAAGLSMDF